MKFFPKLEQTNSKLSRFLSKHCKTPIMKGFTKASIKSDILKIEHAGKDLHTMTDVDKNLQLMDIPSLDELKNSLNIIDEMGGPTYFYIIKFQL